MPAITIGRYTPYSTVIHHLDPRLKLFAMVSFMVSIFLRFGSVWTDLVFYGVIFVLIALIMAFARLKFRQLFRQLKALWLMLIFLFFINLLLPPTDTMGLGFLTLFGNVKIYYGSLLQTFYIVFRLVLMIALTLILTASTRPLDLTYAIEWYLSPLKVIRFPTHEVAMTISIALRFIPTLLEETLRIMRAQASRGVDFIGGKLKEKMRAIVSLIVPLFISAFQRSEELANAMEARGYDPSAKRTRYRQLKWTLQDSFVLIAVTLYFVSFLYLNLSGFQMPL